MQTNESPTGDTLNTTVTENVTPGDGPGLFEMPPGIGDVIRFRDGIYVIDGFEPITNDVLLREYRGTDRTPVRFPAKVLDEAERVDPDETKPPTPTDTLEVEGVAGLPGEQIKTLIQPLSRETVNQADIEIQAMIAAGFEIRSEHIAVTDGNLVRVVRMGQPFASPYYEEENAIYELMYKVLLMMNDLMRRKQSRL